MSSNSGSPREWNGSEVAIIGMAGRFPGAPTVERFWENLRDGVESIRFFTDEELLAAGIPACAGMTSMRDQSFTTFERFGAAAP